MKFGKALDALVGNGVTRFEQLVSQSEIDSPSLTAVSTCEGSTAGIYLSAVSVSFVDSLIRLLVYLFND